MVINREPFCTYEFVSLCQVCHATDQHEPIRSNPLPIRQPYELNTFSSHSQCYSTVLKLLGFPPFRITIKSHRRIDFCSPVWRYTPMVPSTWTLRQEDHSSPGILGCSVLCQLGVCTQSDVNMVTSWEQGTTSLPKEG